MTNKPTAKTTLSPKILEMMKKMGMAVTPAIETANRRRLGKNRRDLNTK